LNFRLQISDFRLEIKSAISSRQLAIPLGCLVKRWTRAFGAAVAAAVGGYGGWAVVAFARYGGPHRRGPDEQDGLLDAFIPKYDVYERHTIVVEALPDVTLAAARNQDMFSSPLINAIFKARQWAMGSSPEAPLRQHGLLGSMLAIGWRVLAEVPGREIVVGAVTRPWQANVTFRGIAPEQFAAFHEPDYVKIVWTLRADPINDGTRTLFCTETRAVATDEDAARRFRRYWALASPGISMIRRLGLPTLKATAERIETTAEPSPPLSEPFEQPVL
jgi:hypothetical protein